MSPADVVLMVSLALLGMFAFGLELARKNRMEEVTDGSTRELKWSWKELTERPELIISEAPPFIRVIYMVLPDGGVEGPAGPLSQPTHEVVLVDGDGVTASAYHGKNVARAETLARLLSTKLGVELERI